MGLFDDVLGSGSQSNGSETSQLTSGRLFVDVLGDPDEEERRRKEEANKKSIWQRAGNKIAAQAKSFSDDPKTYAKIAGRSIMSGIDTTTGKAVDLLIRKPSNLLFGEGWNAEDRLRNEENQRLEEEKKQISDIAKTPEQQDLMKAGKFVGEQIPYFLVPESKVGAGVKGIAGVASRSVARGVENTLMGGALDINDNKTIEEIGKNAVTNFAAGTLFSATLDGAIQGISKWKNLKMDRVKNEVVDEYGKYLVSGTNDATIAKELLENGAKSPKISSTLEESFTFLGEDLAGKENLLSSPEGVRSLASSITLSKMSDYTKKALYKEIKRSGAFKVERGDKVDDVIQRAIESVLNNETESRTLLPLTSRYTDSVFGVINPKLSQISDELGELSRATIKTGEADVITEPIRSESRGVNTPQTPTEQTTETKFKIPENETDLAKQRSDAKVMYRTIGISDAMGAQKENAGLSILSDQFKTPQGKKIAMSELEDAINSGKVKVNEDGTITVYRGGDFYEGNDLISVSTDKQAASEFGDVVEYKVTKDQIASAGGLDPNEILVTREAIAPAAPTTTAPTPKGNSAELRDSMDALDEKIRNATGDERTKLIEQQNKTRDELNAYIEQNKKSVLAVPNKGKAMNLADIEVIQYSDGTWGMTYSVQLSDRGVGGPMSGKYASEQEAIDAGKQKVIDWISRAKSGVQGSAINKQIQEIEISLKGIPEATKTSAQPLESLAKTPQDAPEPRFAKQASETTDEPRFAEKKGESRKISDKIYNTQESADIYAELASAEAGYRRAGAETGVGMERETIYKPSTFPKWIPEKFTKENGKVVDLRDKKLIDKVLDHFAAKTVPTDEVELALYDVIHNELRQRLDMPQLEFPTQGRIYKSQRVSSEKPVKSKLGDIKESRVYQKTRQILGEENVASLQYSEANLNEQAEKATRFIYGETGDIKPEAMQIAMGIRKAPDDMLQESISIAVAQDALKKGDIKTYKELVKARSLRQTRRGQEIVAERGRVDVNSPEHFIKQVLNERMQKAGLLAQEADTGKLVANKKALSDKVDQEVAGLSKDIKAAKIKVEEARKFIDDLICR